MPNFPKYESYKDSGVEWLGEIPEHWEKWKISHLFTLGRGRVIDKGQLIDGGRFPVYSSQTKDNGIFGYLETYDFDGEYITWTTDGANAGTVSYREGKFSCTNVCGTLKKNRNIFVSKFVAYALNSYTPFFVRHDINPKLMNDVMSKIQLFLPPLEEQKRIVEFLDRTTAEIDRAIAQKQRLIELLKEQKAILINQAVTKGLNPNVPMRDSAIEWLGEIPEHWGTIAIKRASRNGYKTFIDGDWIESPYITDDGVRLIQTGNVGIGEYREKGFRYISEYTFQAFNCTQIFPNDVLICRLDGPVGRACLAPDLGVKMITSVDNAILKPSKDFDPRFIVYLMSSDSWLDWIKALCRVGGGFRFRISRSMLGDLKIVFPPLHEQKEIADRLDDALHEISVLINKFLESIDKLSEYRQITISQAVTGKIKV